MDFDDNASAPQRSPGLVDVHLAGPIAAVDSACATSSTTAPVLSHVRREDHGRSSLGGRLENARAGRAEEGVSQIATALESARKRNAIFGERPSLHRDGPTSAAR